MGKNQFTNLNWPNSKCSEVVKKKLKTFQNTREAPKYLAKAYKTA